MHIFSSRPQLRALLAGITALALSGWVAAEPPSRAARLGYLQGTVSFSPAGQPDWVQAVVNLPLTTGDSLWADADSRAELQVGGATIRVGAATSMTLLNLDDYIAQVQLSQGSLKVRVRRLGPDQAFEVDTPNLAFTLRRPGEYRIDVDPNGDATAVMVRSGQAEVYGESTSYAINAQQGYRFYGTGLSDYDVLGPPRDDEFDRWARDRDRLADNSPSARYVSSDVVGYEDLDANGTWRTDPNYGNVWMPARVAAGWTPYRDGHWAWVDPWGWTWVDDAPWGYAVSHYGRWANIGGSWGWVPGPPRERAVYAPALVAFVGGGNLQVSLAIGGGIAAVVGWFPLAPHEVYRPPYAVSSGYFNNINRSNAVIPPATITNIYNTTNVTNIVYANRRVAGAVVAVPAQAFAQSQPVAKAAVAVSKEAAANAPVAAVAAVVPVQQSVHAGAATARTRPPARERAVVAHTAPPPPPVAFAAQQAQLAAKPGAPIDDAQRRQLKPAAPAATAPKVSVVTTAQAVAPTAPPPATPPAGKSPQARRADAARGDAGKADAAKADTAKGDAAKADATKLEAAKAESAKADALKAESARIDAAKAQGSRVDAAKGEAAKAAAARAETSRADAMKGEAAKADAAKADAAKAATARIDAAKAESAKADAAKNEAARADAARGEAAKAAAARAEASRIDAAKGEAVRADAAKAEAAKAAAAKAEASRADAAKAEAGRADAMKAEAARADAVKADTARAAAARAEASRADAAKAEAARAAAARAEASRVEAAKVEAAKIEAARANAAKAQAAKAATARAEAVKAEEEKKAEEESRKR
jgi:hypothetical protein